VIPQLNETEGHRPVVRQIRFITGIALMAVSFLVYLAYPMILFLAFSDRMKLGIVVVASLLSWGVFCGGFYLAGREGHDWLKGRKVR